jgi:hypothetical protein
MLIRCLTALILAALLSACSESNLEIPDRNSMGVGMPQPLIEIYSPEGDAVLPADTPFTLDYAILRSSNGHHVKIRVDKKKPQIVIRLKGKHQIHGLSAGKHRIRITEFDKNGATTGGDITINVTMQETAQTESPEAE